MVVLWWYSGKDLDGSGDDKRRYSFVPSTGVDAKSSKTAYPSWRWTTCQKGSVPIIRHLALSSLMLQKTETCLLLRMKFASLWKNWLNT